MTELITPYAKGTTYKDGVTEIVDANGMWVFDCHEQDADEILKRINGYPELETKLHDAMQELSELVTKREMVRRLQQRNKELLEALKLNDAMLTKGIFNCTREEMQAAADARKQAITNAKQQDQQN